MALPQMIYLALFIITTSTIAVILGNELILMWKARRASKR